ncbi:hypothetical protein QOZ80_5BG0453910 [Eleusine coracana subsp. coracana]|nr:hypothetical protein QOZ80_5BG0453910 [Eleusine coracana subsp. coracana]
MSSRPALVSSPLSVAALRLPHGHRLYLRPTCASKFSRSLARGATARDQLQPRLVAAQSPPPLAAGGIRRDAETGLAILLVVLAAVMTFSLSLIILSFSAHKAIKKLEIKANKLAAIIAEEVPVTMSSLKLSFMEINDLTSQLQKLRKMFAISRFGKKTSTKTTFRTGQT